MKQSTTEEKNFECFKVYGLYFIAYSLYFATFNIINIAEKLYEFI